jgi:peptidoglycan/xylan/chitin deacetylase (PgdA/CDA1 family)
VRPLRGLTSRSRTPIAIAPGGLPPTRRLAALTFDDGPDPVVTPALLAELERLNVPATFFLLGTEAAAHPEIVRALADAGMELGNHTMTHSRLSSLDRAEQRREIASGADAIGRAGGTTVRWFRPPYGAYDDATLAVCAELGQTMLLWNVDSEDWTDGDERRIARTTAHGAQAPAVILLHATLAATVRALADIVAAFHGAGFTFVTASGLAGALSTAALNAATPVTLGSRKLRDVQEPRDKVGGGRRDPADEPRLQRAAQDRRVEHLRTAGAERERRERRASDRPPERLVGLGDERVRREREDPAEDVAAADEQRAPRSGLVVRPLEPQLVAHHEVDPTVLVTRDLVHGLGQDGLA